MSEEGADAGYRVEIGGDAHGPVVAGPYNVVVDARTGSSVTVQVERERPAPVRRTQISVLPRRVRKPLGRDEDAREMAAAIATGVPVQLCGPAGIGKSTLLRHLARTVECGPDGVVFVSAARRHVADVAQEIFEACYETRGYAPSWTELRRLLTGVRITVFVDEADLTVDQLRELTDVVPAATFVLASRHSSLLGEVVVHYLHGLDQVAATQLLVRTLGRPLRDTENTTATDLWRAAGGSPLLLLRAVGIARSQPGRAELPAPGAVADLLPALVKQLDENATSALNLLSTVHDAELADTHVGALVGVEDPAALCERLVDLGLAVRTEHGYQCAPDVGPVLRQRNVVAFPVERLCQYFTLWATDPATTPEQVAAHSRAVARIAELAADVGLPDLAVSLSRAAAPKLACSLRFDAWGQSLGNGWSAARQAGDREAEAYFTHEAGIRSLITGLRVPAAALLAEAVALWHVLGEDQGTTAALHAQQFLPKAPQSGQGDPADLVADHMADLGVDPSPQLPVEPLTGTPPDDAGWADPGAQQLPDPSEVPGDATSTPDGGASSAPPGDPSTASATTSSTAGAGTAASTGAKVGKSALGWLGVLGATVALVAVLAVAIAVGGTVIQYIIDKIFPPDPPPSPFPVPPVTSVLPTPDDPGSGDEENTGIVGVWETDQGVRTTIVESSPGEYTTPAPCGYGDTTLYGDDTQATGEGPYIDLSEGQCGSVVGQVEITITVDSTGDTIQVAKEWSSGDFDCSDQCGTFTMTRVG